MKQVLIYCLIILILFSFDTTFSQTKSESVTFLTDDNVKVTADLYLIDNNNAPFILLFHQAMFSRGEYIEIAPKLNKLGFNCIAIDQRSGNKINKIVNQTHKDAKSKNKETKYPDAFPDLEAAYKYVNKNYNPEIVLVWGSSYSSSLVFVLAAKHKDIKGLLSFSPGEYFKFEDKMIEDWAEEVECPVFVTSSQKEAEDCSLIFNKIKNKKSIQYIPDFQGFHGSKALWESKEGHKQYWKKVSSFLEMLKNNE